MKKYNASTLPYLAAVAQAIQFSHAGFILLSWWGLLIGGIIGAVVSLAVATAASRVSDIAQKRRRLAWAGLVALLVLSPLALAAPVYISFGDISPDWLRWVSACAWAAAPDLAIVLSGAIAGKSLVSVPVAQPTGQVAQPTRKHKSHRVDRNRMIAQLRADPGVTNAKLAQLFGVSHQAIGKARRAVTPAELGLER